ncbi:hypothetical protein D9758_001672 [Tetrapyrgos nigripes]|uniref:Epoxide hydrolase n=1 Tax=Tetrapyrgos nigripes TaxID=182062 RepID=A0A8H5GXT4_9AGAR|nr:hypothetical protein D9758_001672 [Tetrapyrgos nigripes]
MSEGRFKAVIFDVGGVVMSSPFIAIAQYEKEQGLPDQYINCSIVSRGSQGAWQKFERGELELLPFYEAFSRDLSDTVNGNVCCSPKLFGAMMRTAKVYDPHVREAIRRIRAAGRHKIIALTNNYSSTQATPIPASELAFLGWDDGATPQELRQLFDDFCDSSTLGTRKPEPKFYLMACERNGIQPHEAVFLDDIGINLKAAKILGMETIHVPIGGTLAAVKELGKKIDLDLTGDVAKL